MPPFRAEKLTEMLNYATHAASEQNAMLREEVPCHQALADRAGVIIRADGEKKGSRYQDGSGAVYRTPWYENPNAGENMRHNGRRLFYAVTEGDVNVPDGSTYAILVRITGPNPVNPGEELEAVDTRAVINAPATFVRSGVTLKDPHGQYRGVVDPEAIKNWIKSGANGEKPQAVSSDDQYFKDTAATLEFIAQAAGLNPEAPGASAAPIQT